jgi:hypothetical protein
MRRLSLPWCGEPVSERRRPSPSPRVVDEIGWSGRYGRPRLPGRCHDVHAVLAVALRRWARSARRMIAHARVVGRRAWLSLYYSITTLAPRVAYCSSRRTIHTARPVNVSEPGGRQS